MRTFAVPLLALLVVGCADDPTLHVTVTHPSGLAVVTTTVTDYESETLNCDDVAFGRLSADQLAALAVTSETIDANGHADGGLTGISRTDHKVIVARGLDANDQLLAGGCAELGVVDGATELPIATLPAATVSLGVDSSGADPNGVIVTATDPGGAPLDGRAVSWTVYGPAGSMPAGTATSESDGVWQASAPSCTNGGVIHVHPVPPAVVGGFEAQVRVAWATELPPPYTALVNGGFALQALAPPAGSRRYCAARVTAQTRSLVCLEGNGANAFAREYRVGVDATGKATLTAQPGPKPVPYAAAIVSVPGAGAGDLDVLAIDQAGVLVPVLSTMAVSNSDPVCGALPCATPVDDAVYIPACGTLAAKLVLHVQPAMSGDTQLWQLPPAGGTRGAFPLSLGTAETTAQLDRAGCVTDLLSTPRQAVAIQQGTVLAGTFVPTSTHLSYDCSGATCSETPLLAGVGVGFTGGSEPRVVITAVDATGVVLVQSVFAGTTAQRHLVERARVPALSVPDHIVAGQFDSDSTTDMLWTVPARRGVTTTVEIGYARQVNGQPLEAISAPQPFTVDDLQSVDLDGDGHDDLIMTGATLGGVHGVLVIPSYAALPASTTADPPCP